MFGHYHVTLTVTIKLKQRIVLGQVVLRRGSAIQGLEKWPPAPYLCLTALVGLPILVQARFLSTSH